MSRNINLECACFEARLKSRLTTNYFNRYMPRSLSITKFHLLAEIEAGNPCNLTRLAVRMGMDRTTLSRAVNILVKSGFLSQSANNDKRKCVYALTDSGREIFEKAYPAWEEAMLSISDC